MIHLHLSSGMSGLLGGGFLMLAVYVALPNLSGKRRLVTFVLLAFAILMLVGSVTTARVVIGG